MGVTTKGIPYPSDYSAKADIPADLKKMAEKIDEVISTGGNEGTMVYKGAWMPGQTYPVGSVIFEKGQYWISLDGDATSRYPSEESKYWRALSVVSKEYVDEQNKKAIEVAESYTDEQYNKINGTVIYANEEGATGDITLTENLSNYEYIEVFWKVGESNMIEKVSVMLNQNINLSLIDYVDSKIWIYTKTMKMTDTQLIVQKHKEYSIEDSGQWTPCGAETDSVEIVKVVGYK